MLSSLSKIASTTEIFSLYNKLMLVEPIIDQFIFCAKRSVPEQVQTYIASKFEDFFAEKGEPPDFTLIINEEEGAYCNAIYKAAETYLKTIINPTADRLQLFKGYEDHSVLTTMEDGSQIVDHFEGIKLTWQLKTEEKKEENWFELTFQERYKEKVMASYLQYVLDKAEAIEKEKTQVNLSEISGESTELNHPSTFDTLAMDPEQKMDLIKDLDRFLARKEYYKRVGKAWKRGYLLYGPPGTGKSSLIAAMANYLKFDIYDMTVRDLQSKELKKLLVRTGNKSIIVIEDIDCGKKLNRNSSDHSNDGDTDSSESDTGSSASVNLSDLLNCIDGLWSCCGDERIIIFTTNYKERLDPALLRPGRMDKHIYMSYCTFSAFKILASNYLQIQDHPMFEEIKSLMENIEVTPAEIAELLMENDDADVVLDGLVKFFKQKKLDMNAKKDEVKENKPNKRNEKKKKKKAKNKNKSTNDDEEAKKEDIVEEEEDKEIVDDKLKSEVGSEAENQEADKDINKNTANDEVQIEVNRTTDAKATMDEVG